jgi:hypothetical protein
MEPNNFLSGGIEQTNKQPEVVPVQGQCGTCKHARGAFTYPGLPGSARVCHLNPPTLFMFPIGQGPDGSIVFQRVAENVRVDATAMHGCWTKPGSTLLT